MNVLRSIAMAFSTFSKLPVPRVDWKDENMRYMLVALPLVALPIGLTIMGFTALCNHLRFSDALYACGVTLLPLFVTGGVHMDGFCDTVDALSSHAEPARKLAILKDPHPGAFAVVFTCAYLLCYFALAAQLPRTGRTALMLLIMHTLSRVAGAFAALAFPLAGSGGMLAACRDAAALRRSKAILIMAFLLCAAGMAATAPLPGLGMAAACGLCALYVRRMSARQFGGMRGDLVGYLIALSEIAMLASMALLREVPVL